MSVDEGNEKKDRKDKKAKRKRKRTFEFRSMAANPFSKDIAELKVINYLIG